MNVLFITQFFYPELTAGAFRTYGHALCWSKDKINVTIFTGFPNDPAGKIYDGYTAKLLLDGWTWNMFASRAYYST